jgi:hypothetical protein
MALGEEEPIPLTLALEALIDGHGITPVLIATVAVCWAKAAKAEHEGKDPRAWERLAMRLDEAWKDCQDKS